ncbi:CopG domain protein [Natrialba magadii ATCC 43099]|uniref:CopG domain protein n=1 Tax=Natrialba magadii (strain ATCC 43099 / DSM 3394 / CCM 3739 / CIP 104546 / IAM 13178 / JCM 8861 / NBRC 102185 / NCIMB 2190 / MS3) TaxID=547559 RepID=D3SWD5_NATMM|nr:hypothetical protein [Natrialba magadii]ADD03727.1 CopG domain protein [Natrialba magadii ATCC 43099]ELY33782.1 hypothetical protein C500_01113 [Natrialba magadii ATCC 43099]
MSTASDTGDATTRIEVRVPHRLLEKIDEEDERRGGTWRSGAVRDWIEPPVRLSDETLEELVESSERRENASSC